MRRRPLKPCAQPGCPNLVESGRCADHDRKRQYYRDHPRGSSTAQGYGQRWRRARARFLRAHPLCVRCGAVATVVDHKVPHRGNPTLFWDEANWQSMCKPCHDAKTARQGRWGRRSIFLGSTASGSGGGPVSDPVRVFPRRSQGQGGPARG
jgi:5-methylcytosine-specific restriction protein A